MLLFEEAEKRYWDYMKEKEDSSDPDNFLDGEEKELYKKCSKVI